MLWSSFAAASALASRFRSRRSTFLLMPTSFGLCLGLGFCWGVGGVGLASGLVWMVRMGGER